MTGDLQDIVKRLKSVLPPWFSDVTPVLTAVLNGLATMWAFVYSLVQDAKLQSRIMTATDGWLDMIAGDFFGAGLQRTTYETDQSYRALIQASIFRERNTRHAAIKLGIDITGRTSWVIELGYPLDTGAYQYLYGYGAAGAYGSVSMKYNFFIRSR